MLLASCEQQLLAELNTARYISRAKDHHISMLEEELQATQVKMISHDEMLEQKQRCCNRKVRVKYKCIVHDMQ